MSKPKVVPIQPPVVSIQHDPFGRPEPTIVRRDETKVGDVRQRRIIMNIGRQRIAFDFASRITELKPGTGDQPAPVLPLDSNAASARKVRAKPATRRTS